MKIFKAITDIKAYLKQAKMQGLTVGLVPTMGYLHKGHLSLIRECKNKCDVVVVSIFVNPLQFGPQEDFAEYPRNLNKDAELAEAEGVDVIFCPEAEEMYPINHSTYVEVKGLTEKLCGKSRPGHFRGVTTVVAKLFNIIQPDFAFFGQKDAQQALVIQKMVKDLNMGVQIITVPTVREKDGLALSSRNVYLSPDERTAAIKLSKSLKAARLAVEEGERDAAKLKKSVQEIISSEPLAQIDYIEILKVPELTEITYLEGLSLLALAVRFGETRLIDNAFLEV